MNTSIFYLTIITFLTFSLGQAQIKLNDNELNRLKTAVLENANKTETILSDFTQKKHLSIMEHAIVSEGKLAFQAPNFVKWEYTQPYKNIAIFKDDKLYVNDNGKKNILNLSSNKLFRSLNSLIVNSIKGDMFDDTQFEISYFKNDDGFLVKFIPKDKRLKRFVAQFQLQFSKATTHVESVKLIEPNEDYTLIIFNNRQINATIPKNTFNH